MNLIEQYIVESTDHHEEAVSHVKSVVNGAYVGDYHKHDAKQTGAHPVSKDQMGEIHKHLVGSGYSHKSNKAGDVHVYKKGKTTVTSYHGDSDVNIHTKH